LAKSHDLILGIVGVLFLNDNVCEIKRLYVRSRWRRTGIAYSLLQSAISKAQTLGCRKAILISLKRLQAAISLYNALGFKQIDIDSPEKKTYGDLVSFELVIDTKKENRSWRLEKYVAWDIRYCKTKF
jgi:GNAT superfamily N-acetyltransferase